MHDLTIFSKDQLRKIARTTERETDLLADATEKFIPLYDVHGKITDKVAEEAIKLTNEVEKEAEMRGLSEIKSYQFRKEYIQNHPVS